MIRITLRAKTVIGITILIISVAGILSLFFIQQERETILHFLKLRGHTIATYLAFHTEKTLLTQEISSLDALFTHIVQQPEVMYSFILDKDGNTLLSKGFNTGAVPAWLKAGMSKSPQGSSHFQLLEDPEGRSIYHFSMPIKKRDTDNGDNIIGILNLGISTHGADILIEQRQQAVILITVILILIASIIAAILTRIILVPIHKLQLATTRVSEGDLLTQVKVRTRDELEELAHAFNKMTEDLRLSRKRLESRSDELEVKVSERTKDLEINARALKNMLYDLREANRTLEETQSQLLQSEKMAAIGQLSAGVAHEIKNPLAIILLSAEYLEDCVPQMDEKAKKNLKMIKDAAERANRVVIELLNFSRTSSVELGPCNLYDILTATLNLVSNKTRINEIEVKTDYKTDLKKTIVRGEPILLEQAFLNIINNAVDAIGSKGSILIRTHLITDAKVKQKIRRGVSVEFVDDGVGIPQDKLSRIFDPFFTTKEQGKGTGLGLSTVYMIIEKHKGVVDVESLEGEGTTFKVHLPLEPEEKIDKEGKHA